MNTYIPIEISCLGRKMTKKIKPFQMVWNLLSSKEPDSKVVGKKEETNLQHTIRGIQI